MTATDGALGSGSSAPATAAGSAAAPSDDAPTRATGARGPDTPATVALCGPVPTSSGPLAKLARLTLGAPARAAIGTTVTAAVTVTMNPASPRVVTIAAASALLVVRDGEILAGTRGGSQTGTLLQPGASAPQLATAVPTSTRLDTCAGGTTKLAAGQYSLVAVLGYRVDSLNSAADDAPAEPGRQTFVLVSPPSPLTVT